MTHQQWLPTDTMMSSGRRPARPSRHSTWTVVLHWSSVAALLIAVACILLREVVEAQHIRTLLLEAHRQFGLFVLLAWGLRLAVRFKGGMAKVGEHSGLMNAAAQIAHLGLYALLLALPVLGLLANSARGMDVKLFGLLPLPNLVAASDPDVADTLIEYHSMAAWALLVLVVAHVVAALWHHLVRRDGVLVAMLPVLKRRVKPRRRRATSI